jgi:hypothetical protein
LAWIAGLGAATTERVVTDFHTGLAIGGFDPVAYFTKSKAMLGRGEFETRHARVIWRFSNAGNRAAFVEHPDVYMPAFGGYDPLGIARGVAVAGHPTLWLISGERLYLFHDVKSRAAFAAAPEESRAAAERRWPAVQSKLVE